MAIIRAKIFNLRDRGHASTRGPVQLENFVRPRNKHAVECVDGLRCGCRAGQLDEAVASASTKKRTAIEKKARERSNFRTIVLVAVVRS